MNELLALKVIRELAAAEEVYREALKMYADDLDGTLFHKKIKDCGDKARAFLIEFDE